jgi:hypothetical protein
MTPVNAVPKVRNEMVNPMPLVHRMEQGLMGYRVPERRVDGYRLPRTEPIQTLSVVNATVV